MEARKGVSHYCISMTGQDSRLCDLHKGHKAGLTEGGNTTRGRRRKSYMCCQEADLGDEERTQKAKG